MPPPLDEPPVFWPPDREPVLLPDVPDVPDVPPPVPDEPERPDPLLVPPVSSSSSPIPSELEPPPVPPWPPTLPRDDDPPDELPDEPPDDPPCDPDLLCMPESRSISSPLDSRFRFWSAIGLPSNVF
jgi:hypothetical protein